MNFYREWKRWYVQIDWGNPYLNSRIAIGRWPREPHVGDDYAADDTLSHVGPTVWEIRTQQDLHDALQEAWTLSHAVAPSPVGGYIEPHPFQDPDALTGNITTPAGAQDFTVVPQEGGGGWGVVDVTRAAYVPNPVNQSDEE